jgi:hypothetical protein
MLASALDTALAPGTFDPQSTQLLYSISGQLWKAGNIFFGLWLVPMGWLCWRAGFGPRALGWILVCGGIGYVISAFLAVLAPAAGLWVAVFPVAATVGEFWMIGLLLWKGLRPLQGTSTPGASQSG